MSFNGVINIYKPAGITSHGVVSRVRRILGMKKVGHTGTLDPDADGVLPICVGKGTKLSEMLMNKDKTYVAVVKLGVATDTQDSSGNILEIREVTADKEAILDVIMGFVGQIEQVPPMYSAIKIGGRKLYELARQGLEVERKARNVTIYSIDVNNISNDSVTITVDCSKGTYIRTLCHDIGEKLGCGAHMEKLTRTRAGKFDIKDSVTLEELSGNHIINIDEFFDEYEKIIVTGENLYRVLNGADINVSKSDGKYRLYDEDGNFLSVSMVENGGLKLVKAFW